MQQFVELLCVMIPVALVLVGYSWLRMGPKLRAFDECTFTANRAARDSKGTGGSRCKIVNYNAAAFEEAWK